MIDVTSCMGEECLSDQEIDEYLDTHGLAVMMNSQKYQPEVYTEEAIIETTQLWTQNLKNERTRKSRAFKLQLNNLSAIDSLSGK